MPKIKRTVIAPDKTDSDLVKEAANQSETQWIFCPYTRCDTADWSVPTGVGLIPIAQLYPVSNVDDKGDPKGFRYALVVANEIERKLPRRVKRIASLSGMANGEYVDILQALLLGEESEATELAGDDQLVPNGRLMQGMLRSRIQEIGERATAGQTLLEVGKHQINMKMLLDVGKELDQALQAAIADAERIIGEKQKEVQGGVKTSFDIIAQRSFLFLGQQIPTTLKLVPGDSGLDAKVAKLEEKFEEKDEEIADLKKKLKKSKKKAKKPVEVKEVKEEIEEPDTESTTPTRCIAKTKSGNQCGNDALEGSDFCFIASHK